MSPVVLRGLQLAIVTSLLGGCKASPNQIEDGSGAPLPEGLWQPKPGTTWQWQLMGPIETSLAVQMYDLDLFDTPDATIASLHARGIRVVCYFSAGSHENWRADAAAFPSSVIGSALDGWVGERWLDIRAPEVRTQMQARLAQAKQRGCDGVEPDNVDGYANTSGFPLTGADQLSFNRFLANEAHALGLSIGLKNDLDQVPMLVGDFDWALNEECASNDECDALEPFIAANKAVFHVEYGTAALATTVCPAANGHNFDTLIKNLDLDGWRVACR